MIGNQITRFWSIRTKMKAVATNLKGNLDFHCTITIQFKAIVCDKPGPRKRQNQSCELGPSRSAFLPKRLPIKMIYQLLPVSRQKYRSNFYSTKH